MRYWTVQGPERAPIIRALFTRYAAGGETYDTLREFIASRGVLPKRQNKKLIERDRIAIILSNPVYYGDFRWCGEIHKGTHTPIISSRLFNRVQEVSGSRVRMPLRKSVAKPVALRGLLRCGSADTP